MQNETHSTWYVKHVALIHIAHWGCPILKAQVLQRIKPKVHIFGHVHDAYGSQQIDQTMFINCSMDWRPIRKPVYFEYRYASVTSDSTTMDTKKQETSAQQAKKSTCKQQ